MLSCGHKSFVTLNRNELIDHLYIGNCQCPIILSSNWVDLIPIPSNYASEIIPVQPCLNVRKKGKIEYRVSQKPLYHLQGYKSSFFSADFLFLKIILCQNFSFFFYFQPIFGILPCFHSVFPWCFFFFFFCKWPLTPLRLLENIKNIKSTVILMIIPAM